MLSLGNYPQHPHHKALKSSAANKNIISHHLNVIQIPENRKLTPAFGQNDGIKYLHCFIFPTRISCDIAATLTTRIYERSRFMWQFVG